MRVTIIFLIFLGIFQFCSSHQLAGDGEQPIEENNPFSQEASSSVGRHKRQTGLTCSKPMSHDATYPTDCADILRSCSGQSPPSGQYMIQPDGGSVIKVYCDMETDGGGWTVFQRRVDGTIDFYRAWNDYYNGFGNLNTEFWLGNDNLHYLTSQKDYELRVDLTNNAGNKYYEIYDKFRIGDSFSEFVLVLGSASGTAGDGLSYSNRQRFSTYNNDNDAWSSNCASYSSYRGAWWYKACVGSNLNGGYYGYSGYASISWNTLPGSYSNILFSEMKVRPTE